MVIPRRAKNTDANKRLMVRALRKIKGISVAVDHDDILLGYKGFTYWYEVKNPNTVSKKTGEIRESAIKESQKKLRDTWKGHYRIIHDIQQILDELGL